MSEAETGEAVRKQLAKLASIMLARAINPSDVLKEAIDNRKWFRGLIFSTIFFEMFGVIVLVTYFRHGKKGSEHQKIVTKFLDRLGLMRLIQLLYLLDLVKLGTYRKMKKIVKERNKWIHRARSEKKDFTYLIDAEPQDVERITHLIEDAIDCLKELGARD